MVYGHTDIERIQLNDDSLWYGRFIDRNNSSLKSKLPEIRRLILDADIYHAEAMIMQHMVGTPAGMRHYTLLRRTEHRHESTPAFRHGIASN